MSESYRCPNCNAVHTDEEWNKGTADFMGEPKCIASLPDHFKDDETRFYCPSCRGMCFGDELSIHYDGPTDDGEEIRVGRVKERAKSKGSAEHN